jgi:predicted RNase H-like HicB family nuclease
LIRHTVLRKKVRSSMRNFTAVIEKCSSTGLYVGYVPGFPGAHSQGETLEELNQNLKEVIELLLEDGEPRLELGRDISPIVLRQIAKD